MTSHDGHRAHLASFSGAEPYGVRIRVVNVRHFIREIPNGASTFRVLPEERLYVTGMVWLIVVAAIAVGLAFAQHRGWVDFTGKHQSSGGMGLLGLADELFAPNRHEIEALREAERQLPAPAVGAPDGDLGIAPREATASSGKYQGHFRLDL